MDNKYLVLAAVAAVALVLVAIVAYIMGAQSNLSPPATIKSQQETSTTLTTIKATTSTTTTEPTTTTSSSTTSSSSTSSSTTSTTTSSSTSTTLAHPTTTTTILQPQRVMLSGGRLCVDSDGGENYYVNGVLTVSDRIVWSDACLNPSQLQEGYCDKRILVLGYRTRVYDCPDSCFMGACWRDEPKRIVWQSNNTTTTTSSTTSTTLKFVTSTTASTTTTTNPAQVVVINNGLVCRDSDGGVNYNIRGITTVNDEVLWTDACLNPSYLQEGYCDKTSKKHYRVVVNECLKGCKDGACLK